MIGRLPFAEAIYTSYPLNNIFIPSSQDAPLYTFDYKEPSLNRSLPYVHMQTNVHSRLQPLGPEPPVLGNGPALPPVQILKVRCQSMIDSAWKTWREDGGEPHTHTYCNLISSRCSHIISLLLIAMMAVAKFWSGGRAGCRYNSAYPYERTTHTHTQCMCLGVQTHSHTLSLFHLSTNFLACSELTCLSSEPNHFQPRGLETAGSPFDVTDRPKSE